VGDCYYLATLAAVARTDPSVIRQSVADLGDGTYVVQFCTPSGSNGTGGGKVYVRVSGDLPVNFVGGLAYAKLGAQNSLWVAIMEKAYTFFRRGAGTYVSIDGGWMDEVFSSLGKSYTDLWNPSSADALLAQIQQDLADGDAVTWATAYIPPSIPLVGGHAYTVVAVVTDPQGNRTGLRLRNPWGVDGAGNDGANDGYVTISALQAISIFFGVVSAKV
jgi:hypothetical protein